jgi:hypothetical protein
MTRLNKILAALLAVQLGLAILVLSRNGETVSFKQELVLAGFDAAAVTRLQVFDAPGKPGVDLVKRGSSWVLASHWDHPVDPKRIDAALGPLAKATAGDPIATSASRHKQQKVADQEFEKKLVISAAGKDTTLLIGVTRGRRTSVRLAGDDRVLGASGLATGALSGLARDWVAATYSEIPRDDIEKIAIHKGAQTIELDRTGSATAGSGSGAGSGSAAPERTWRLAIDGQPVTLAAGEQLDSIAIDTVVSDITSIAAAPADPRRDASKPTATVHVTRKSGTTVTFEVVADGESYWIKQRGTSHATLVDKARFEAVVTADRSKLIQKPEPAPKPGAGSAVPP